LASSKYDALAPRLQLLQMAAPALWVSRALYACAQLGIADLLNDGPRTAGELALATQTDPRSLHRVLRALASRGVFTEVDPGRFALTDVGAALRTGTPGSMRNAVLTLAGDWQWAAWGEFLHCLKTGQSGMQKAWRMPLFDFLAGHPDHAHTFNAAMLEILGEQAQAIVSAYDFSGLTSVVDLGGGTGHLLVAILRAHPQLRGLVLDLDYSIAQAQERLRAAGLTERGEARAGDFFHEVPPGYDAYVFSRVIHDWNDEQALAMLRTCRAAMKPGARLLIIEHVLPPGDAPHFGKLLDLLMLTVTGGIERSEDEYRALLAQGRFRLARVVPTSTPLSVLEAEPA
jgi:SAM-dependent methyltransferase